MRTNTGYDGNILLEDFVEIAYFEDGLWIKKDFYPLVVDVPSQGFKGYTTKNSDFISFDIESGLEEGNVTLKVPYTLEGQKGTIIGDFFLNRDLALKPTIAIINREFYSITDSSYKYSSSEKGVLTLEGIQFNEWFKNVLIPPNCWRSFVKEVNSKKQKGYKGKIYFNKKQMTTALEQCFERGFTTKRKIPKPGGNLNVIDTAKQPQGFRSFYVDNYFAVQCSMELEPQGFQEIINHLNNKYNFYIKMSFFLERGMITPSINGPQKYPVDIMQSYENIEYTSFKNKDFLNDNITLNANARYETTYQKKTKFVPFFLEGFEQSEKFNNEEDAGPSEEISNTKKYAKIKLNTVILEGITDLETFLKINVGDIIGERVVLSKKITMEAGNLQFNIAFDEAEEINSGVSIDVPDIDNNVNSDAVFLYYNLSSINSELKPGKKLKPNTQIANESDNFFLQAQNSSVTIEDFRRRKDNLDSVGGTHDPMIDFENVGTINSPINLTYRTNDDVDFTDSFPNIGIRFSDSIVNTPSLANSEVIQIGTDSDFGNYVLIKFK